MCVIEVPWYVVETNHQVVIHDDEGDFVAATKNAAVAKNVVNMHNKWLTTTVPRPGGLAELFMKNKDKKNGSGGSETQ